VPQSGLEPVPPVGSTPTRPANAEIAHLVEHRTCNAVVAGSSPAFGPIFVGMVLMTAHALGTGEVLV
jgi:hypothetical protein